MDKYLWSKVQEMDLKFCTKTIGKSADILELVLRLEGEDVKVACKGFAAELRLIEQRLKDFYGF